jgi:hypothetical protein
MTTYTTVAFSGAAATYYQVSGNWLPSQMIDGLINTGDNGWAIYRFDDQSDPTLSETALLTLASPVVAGPHTWTITINQFSLGYTTDATPSLSSIFTPFTITAATSLNGSTLTSIGNGELLDSGLLPITDVYTITVTSNSLEPITGLFLNAIDDPANGLPTGGPGRFYGNGGGPVGQGNFVVSELTAEVSASNTITLNFEGLPSSGFHAGGPIPNAAQLSTQYLTTYGVSFTSGSAYVAVVNLGVGHATSGTNGIGGSTPEGILTYAQQYPITATFFDPSNPAVAGTTDFVSLRGDLIGLANQLVTLTHRAMISKWEPDGLAAYWGCPAPIWASVSCQVVAFRSTLVRAPPRPASRGVFFWPQLKGRPGFTPSGLGGELPGWTPVPSVAWITNEGAWRSTAPISSRR